MRKLVDMLMYPTLLYVNFTIGNPLWAVYKFWYTTWGWKRHYHVRLAEGEAGKHGEYRVYCHEHVVTIPLPYAEAIEYMYTFCREPHWGFDYENQCY
jgi:hypothetical protein